MKRDKRLIYPEYTKNKVRRAGELVRVGNITADTEKNVENLRKTVDMLLVISKS